MKTRTTLVVALSSVIISSVLALTIFGFYAYLEWKQKTVRESHKLALYDLNGKLYDKYISLGLHAKIDKEDTFKNKPIVWGTIKNNSGKKIYSLRLKISFRDASERVLYVDTFYPIGLELEHLIKIVDITKKTRNFMGQGDSISFKHQLNNCPIQVLDYLKEKSKFAKFYPDGALELTHKIEGLDIR